MSIRSYFLPEAKTAVRAAIAEFESHTSAELVVAVRDRSGHYKDADYLVGFVFALAGLCVFLFHPAPFRNEWFPLEMTILFVLGALFSSQVPALRRLLLSGKRLEANVKNAARAAFVDLGISKTRGRTGILVFVSAFERRVELVCDIGAGLQTLGPAFQEKFAQLHQIVGNGESIERFLSVLKELGPLAGKALPHRDDDIDELSNEVSA